MNERLVVSESELARQRDFAERVRALPERPRSFHIVTMGCQMNERDSETIAGMLVEMGLRPESVREKADLILYNTCCVRENAENRALGNVIWLKELKKERPELLICVGGCMAQEAGMAERMKSMYPFIDLVFGTHNMHRLPEYLLRVLESRRPVVEVLTSDGVIAEGLPQRRVSPFSAFVNIMYGCNNFCSYCIVPYVRGRERSRKPEAVLEECKRLVDQGVKEITLLGQNVNAFGRDTHGDGVSFAALLEKVAALPGLKRLRYVTPHPKDMGPEDVAAFANIPQLCPRLHLPLQAGSDAVLKRMGRKYDSARYLELVASLRDARPDIALSTDLIVGFPGETEEDFAATLELMRASDFMSSFSFCYSDRPGTRASRFLDKIAPDVQQDRLLRLQALQEELSQRWLDARVGQECEVLLENASRREATDDDSLQSWQGRDIYGALVHVPLPAGDHTGRLVNARIVEAKKHSLVAEATGQPW